MKLSVLSSIFLVLLSSASAQAVEHKGSAALSPPPDPAGGQGGQPGAVKVIELEPKKPAVAENPKSIAPVRSNLGKKPAKKVVTPKKRKRGDYPKGEAYLFEEEE